MAEPNLYAAVTAIKDRLLEQQEAAGFSGLLNGKAGTMLFLVEYARVWDDPEPLQACDRLLAAINHKRQQGLRKHSLAEGTAGIAWSHSFVCNAFPGRFAPFSNTEEETALLKKQLTLFLDRQNTDYLHGATGVLKVLALNHHLQEGEEKALIRYFREAAIKTEKGIAWQTRFYQDRPGIYTGLAHGTPAIINALGSLSAPEKQELMEPAVEDLYHRVVLREEQEEDGNTAFTCPAHYHSWCTSYLGACLVALKYLRQREYWQQYHTLTGYISRRLAGFTAAAVTDPCLCHGSAGLLTMLALLSREEDNESLQHLQEALVQKTVDLVHPPAAAEGNRIPPRLAGDTSLLTGLAGIGLALLHRLRPNPLLLQIMNLD